MTCKVSLVHQITYDQSRFISLYTSEAFDPRNMSTDKSLTSQEIRTVEAETNYETPLLLLEYALYGPSDQVSIQLV